jgi:hypothetical protein
VRAAFAHDAVLEMEPGADLAAPGGAVTLALCGVFDHPPPCPLAPHHTRAERRTDGVAVRVLFATDVTRETEMRARIDQAPWLPAFATPPTAPAPAGRCGAARRAP